MPCREFVNARKWFLLTLAAAIAIAAIVWRCLSVPHETLTFKFVDAFNHQPLRVTVAIDEHAAGYFPALEKLFQWLALFRAPAPAEHVCSDGTLRDVRLAKDSRRQTTIVCSSPFHQTAVVLYSNGTNRLDAIGLSGHFTNYATYSLILASHQCRRHRTPLSLHRLPTPLIAKSRR